VKEVPLFKIALRNIRRNTNEYLLYFLSMVFAIMIFYTFSSLKYNTAFSQAIASSEKIKTGFSAATIVMGGFSIIFIWYSNLFFTKRRKREFGLYSLMGVKKRQIGRLHFYETIILGLIAIATGILTGLFFSKLFAMILVRLMRYQIDVGFFLNWPSVKETLIVFSIIFSVVSLQGYYIAYRYKLIDMFHYSKKGQKLPKSSLLIAILSICMIGISYYLSHSYFYQNPLWGMVTTLILAITGTYLFFRHFLYLYLRTCQKKEAYLYQSINLLSHAMLRFKIKSNYRMLATIAILSAVTLTTIGTAYSFYYLNEADSRAIAPVAFSYEFIDTHTDQEISNLIRNSQHSLKFYQKIEIIRLPLQFKEIESPILMKDWETQKTYGSFIRFSDYNIIAKHRNLEKIHALSNHEVVMMMPYYNETYFPDYVGTHVINQANQISFSVSHIFDFSIISPQFAQIVFVVQDDPFETLRTTGEISQISMFEVDKAADSGILRNNIAAVLPETTILSDFFSVYQQMIEGRGIFVFISAFVGIIFLFATGTIMFFRQLTEINEEKDNYSILRNIGLTKREMENIIKKQMTLIFGLPVILGIIHAFVATDILSQIMNVNLIVPIVASFSVYCIIYLGFYLLTVSSAIKMLSVSTIQNQTIPH